MKKTIILVLILIILAIIPVVMILTGCAAPDDNTHITTLEQSNRFVTVETYGMNFKNVPPYRIIVDTYTKVSYIYIGDSTGNAITVLVDADGKPLLWEGALE